MTWTRLFLVIEGLVFAARAVMISMRRSFEGKGRSAK